MTIGRVTQAVAWLRQREALPRDAVAGFDEEYSIVLRRALTTMA